MRIRMADDTPRQRDRKSQRERAGEPILVMLCFFVVLWVSQLTQVDSVQIPSQLRVHELFTLGNCSTDSPSAIVVTTLHDQFASSCKPKDCDPSQQKPTSRVRCIESNNDDEIEVLKRLQADQMAANRSHYVLLERFDQHNTDTSSDCSAAPNQIAMVWATNGECISAESDSATPWWPMAASNDTTFGSWCVQLSSDGESVTLILFRDLNCLWAIHTTTALFTECVQNQMRFQKRLLLVPNALANKSTATNVSANSGSKSVSGSILPSVHQSGSGETRINDTQLSVFTYYVLTLFIFLALGIILVIKLQHCQHCQSQPTASNEQYHQFQPTHPPQQVDSQPPLRLLNTATLPKRSASASEVLWI